MSAIATNYVTPANINFSSARPARGIAAAFEKNAALIGRLIVLICGNACRHKYERGEEGEGNCRRYRELCRRY
jgi:hypothetical protein